MFRVISSATVKRSLTLAVPHRWLGVARIIQGRKDLSPVFREIDALEDELKHDMRKIRYRVSDLETQNLRLTTVIRNLLDYTCDEETKIACKRLLDPPDITNYKFKYDKVYGKLCMLS